MTQKFTCSAKHSFVFCFINYWLVVDVEQSVDDVVFALHLVHCHNSFGLYCLNARSIASTPNFFHEGFKYKGEFLLS